MKKHENLICELELFVILDLPDCLHIASAK